MDPPSTYDAIVKQFEDLLKGRIRLLLCGSTQSGKSSAILKMFGDIDAKKINLPIIGNGTSTTMSIDHYEPNSIPLGLWDTRGLESASDDALIMLYSHLDKSLNTENEADKMHVVWYVINGESGIVQSCDVLLIRVLRVRYNLPVIVCINKSDVMRKEYYQQIVNGLTTTVHTVNNKNLAKFAKIDSNTFSLNMETSLIVRTAFRSTKAHVDEMMCDVCNPSTKMTTMKKFYLCEECNAKKDLVLLDDGISALESITCSCLPQSVKYAWASCQIISSSRKIQTCILIITGSSLAGAVSGLIPIPLIDDALMFPISYGMIRAIHNVYDPSGKTSLSDETLRLFISTSVRQIGTIITIEKLGDFLKGTVIFSYIGSSLSFVCNTLIVLIIGITFTVTSHMSHITHKKLSEIIGPNATKMILDRVFQSANVWNLVQLLMSKNERSTLNEKIQNLAKTIIINDNNSE